ncbi:MAG: DNA ligase [Bacteroidetes bacterium]|nr:DNA ligase [Bacteroidota bacterium]
MSEKEREGSEYEEKRTLETSGEPAEGEGSLDWATERPFFVIQKHDASNLHYDFRIEVDGVLKSWAVPKGPSTDPSEKRLAIPTEDHPLGYADFEGVIPEDEYGGGVVQIWDRGGYRPLTDADDQSDTIASQIENGKVTIWLEGAKLSGGYALIRTGNGDESRWLLVKTDDEKADARRNPVSTEQESVKTGRTIEEIREAESA